MPDTLRGGEVDPTPASAFPMHGQRTSKKATEQVPVQAVASL
jgi:hypothetical protein